MSHPTSIDKNGTVQTLQKNTFDSLVFYETKMNPKFLDSIIALTKDAEENSFEPNLNKLKKVWYCGPTLRFRIKYKNGEDLSFNYMYISAYSKNPKLKIVPALYDHIVADSINGRHIDPYSRYSLTQKQQGFEKFTIDKDKIGFEKIVEKLKTK